jgi:hypothetical protein
MKTSTVGASGYVGSTVTAVLAAIRHEIIDCTAWARIPRCSANA